MNHSVDKSPQYDEPRFERLIQERFGIAISSKNNDLYNTIHSACKKFKCTADEYFEQLINCREDSPFLEHLINGITVGETYFFRDKKQIHLLKNILLPRIIINKRKENNLSLRIWSPGCASGEEIYTIAILLDELLQDKHRWNLHLIGTDIDQLRLEKAKSGVYNPWSMRGVSEYYQRTYFSKNNKCFVLIPKIISQVNFYLLNLNENTYPSLLNGINSFDLIICRNVLIYFKKENIASIMKKINLSLADEGCLLLGASDPVLLEGTDLIPVIGENMLFLRARAKVNIPQDKEKKIPRFITSTKNIIPSKKASPSKEKPLNSAFSLYTKAKELADKAQFELAEQCCKESLVLDSTNRDTYFIYSLILIELKRFQEAETNLKKTLYLDHTFVLGHFHLGLLYVKRKQPKAALKCFQNAIKLVEMQNMDEKVPGTKELTYEQFAKVLKMEIDLYLGVGSANNEFKK